MSATDTTGPGESNDRPLAAFFESLPRETAERGSFTPDEVADILRQDRDAANR